jgi:hypothetical protein
MAVTHLEIRSRTPYVDGAPFGDAGPYERIDGLIYFAVSPGDPANADIVDLDKAARDGNGLVRFVADICLLQPVDPARGNRGLLFDVLNRGRKVVQRQLNRAPNELVPSERIDPGDGFLMRHGWTIAWCGWQWDVVRSAALMGLEAPQALENGRPIQGQVLVQIQTNEREPDHLLADRAHQPYPAADIDDPDAVLTVRDWGDGPRTVIPRGRWRFARDEDGRAVADDTRIRLEGGFEPGRLYEVVYRTRICPVAGAGLLAVRDCVSFLRYADAAAGNPCAGRIDRAIGFGTSQSGRFLRHYLSLGLNLDEAGRQVFDGLLPHVAGARRGEFNHRFAQPSVQYTLSFGHRMPFADDAQTDPRTGERGGLLDRQRARGGVPKVVATNSSAEYWRGDCSLMHTDLAGERDVEPPAGSRIYHFAGTQHGPGTLPLSTISAADGSRGVHGFNAVDYSPLLRAALVNLDRWITEGKEPPPSAFPRLADGTAATPRAVIDAFRAIPGAALPDPERVRTIRRSGLGPDAERGIGRYPAEAGDAYPTYRPAVDADRNELGGLRLPDLTAPVASYTAWNPRHPETGGAGQILNMLGSTLPFPASRAERERRGDPRLSIEERYRDREEYTARVRAAAEDLAAQRFILHEDIELAVRNAAARYDAFAAQRESVAAAD